MRRSLPKGARALICALAVAAAGCAAPLTSPENIGWVTTLVDTSTVSLEAARSFAVPDTVVALDDGTIDHSADREIVAQVRQNLTALGWREVRDTAQGLPDVVVVVGAMTRIEVGVSYTSWYGAWGWMPYWGAPADPSWTWGAPVAAIPYTYEVGTLLLTMVDLNAPRETTKQVPVLWVAAVNAVLSSETTLSQALTGIDQAFTQSPYLRIP
jgi:uncharacterized protein DUF4136